MSSKQVEYSVKDSITYITQNKMGLTGNKNSLPKGFILTIFTQALPALKGDPILSLRMR
jgi:hypothetical protein